MLICREKKMTKEDLKQLEDDLWRSADTLRAKCDAVFDAMIDYANSGRKWAA